MKGFSPTWCKWIEAFTQNGHVGIKINDQIGERIKTRKPFITYFFNIVVDMLTVLIKRAKIVGNLRGWFHI
jgi:hypothetical protein